MKKLLSDVAMLTEHVKNQTVVINRLSTSIVATSTVESDELLEVYPLRSEADFDSVEEKLAQSVFPKIWYFLLKHKHI